MKWAYLLITEDYDVYGTNDKEKAIEAAKYEIVIDVVAGQQILSEHILADELEVREFGWSEGTGSFPLPNKN